jgi:hypothetical protein
MNIANLFSIYVDDDDYKLRIGRQFSTIIDKELDVPPEVCISVYMIDNIDTSGLIKIDNQYSYKSKILFCSDDVGRVMSIEVRGDKYTVSFEKDIDKNYLLSALNLIIKISTINCGGLVVHSSMVGNNNYGVLLTGWGGVGKTSFVLSACKENGISVGDEWNLISNSHIYPMRNHILMMYYDALNNTHLISTIDAIRSFLFKYLLGSYIGKIFERLHITLRCREIMISKLCMANCNVVPLSESIHHFKSKEDINVNLKITSNEYSRIITSNFIHESASLLELLNYLNLANQEKVDYMFLFLKKYKENANKIFKDISCNLSHSRKFNSKHYVDKIVNYDS